MFYENSFKIYGKFVKSHEYGIENASSEMVSTHCVA